MHRLHQRGLAAAARAGQEHVVGRPPLDELARVGIHALFLLVDGEQVLQRHALRVPNGLQGVVARRPACRAHGLPVGGGRCGRGVEAVEQALDARQ